MILYGDLQSGNCLKVKYAADHLGLPLVISPVYPAKGETKTPAFLAKNRYGLPDTLPLDWKAFVAAMPQPEQS